MSGISSFGRATSTGTPAGRVTAGRAEPAARSTFTAQPNGLPPEANSTCTPSCFSRARDEVKRSQRMPSGSRVTASAEPMRAPRWPMASGSITVAGGASAP